MTKVTIDSENLETEVKLDERGVIIEKVDEERLDTHLEKMNTFLRDNSDVSKMTSEEKDAKYKDITEMWSEFQKDLKGIEYNYFATKEEYQYLRKLITQEMEYTVNEIFIAVRVKDNFFGKGDVVFNVPKAQRGVFKVNIDDIVIVYHLFEKNKVKGLGKNAYLFANTLKTIGDINIIFNEYDKISKQASEDIGKWCAGLDTIDQIPTPNTATNPNLEIVN